MEFLIAFLFLVGLTVVAIVLIKRLPKAQSTSATVNQVEDLIDKKKENDLRTPILLFSLFTSLVFVSWVFDASYEKMIEKKIFYSEVEELEDITIYNILPPPPPKKVKPKEPKPVVKDPLEAIIEEKEVIEEVIEEPKEIIEDIIDDIETDIETDIDSEIYDENSTETEVDNTVYDLSELGTPPELITNNGDLGGYLETSLAYVRAPLKNKQLKQNYELKVYYVVEPDGTVSNIVIQKRDQEALGEKRTQIIYETVENMEYVPGTRLTKPVRLLNSLVINIKWNK